MVDDSREAKLMLQQQRQQRHEPEPMVEGDELGWGDDGGRGEYCDGEHMLSPEEYEEMMHYIEEALQEENLRAEAEVGFLLCCSPSVSSFFGCLSI